MWALPRQPTLWSPSERQNQIDVPNDLSSGRCPMDLVLPSAFSLHKCESGFGAYAANSHPETLPGAAPWDSAEVAVEEPIDASLPDTVLTLPIEVPIRKARDWPYALTADAAFGRWLCQSEGSSPARSGESADDICPAQAAPGL